MPLYEGRTVKEAISKALGTTRQVSGPPPKLVAACDGLADQVEEVDNLLRHFEGDYHRFQNQIQNMRSEQLTLLVRLGIDLAAIGLPILKLARARNALRAVATAIRNRERLGQLEFALGILLEIFGILDGINNIRRLREIPSELRSDLAQSEGLLRNIENMQRQLQTVSREYARLGCRKLPSDIPIG